MPYIPVKDAKSELMFARRPTDGKSKNGDYKYKRMYYQYKYPIQLPDGRIKEETAEPLFEMRCKATTKFSKKGNKPKLNCFDMDPADLQGMVELDKARYREIQRFGVDLDEADFDAGNPKRVKGLSFFPVDEKTNQPTGAPPICSLKIDTYGKSKFRYPSGMNEEGKIVFTDVPWEEIMNKSLDVLVIWCMSNEYKNDTAPSAQAFVRSCIILDIADKGDVDPTKNVTANDYLTQDPSIMANVASQMEVHRSKPSTLLSGGQQATPGMNAGQGQMANQGQQGQMVNQGQMANQGQGANQGQMMNQGQMVNQGHYMQGGAVMNQMPQAMPGMPGMGGMSAMPGMPGMGGMTAMPGMGGMTAMPGMGAMSAMPGQAGFAVPGTPNYGQSADLSQFLQQTNGVPRL